MAGYQRQSAADIVPTAVVRAAPINNEYNALRDAFLLANGHRHDGSPTEGGHVPLIADADALNKVVVDTANNRVGVFVEVASAAVEQVRIQDGAIVPVTTADIDLGTSALKFKSAFLSGTAAVDVLTASTSASIPSLTVGTSAVIASADINAGTVDGTVIGASSAQAITGTTITATTGFVGGLTGAVTGNTAGTHTGPVIGAVTGDLTGNVTAATGTSSFNDVTINGGLNMNAGTAATITNLTSPTNAGDAATKGYVDTADALKLNLSGGTMSGAIAMGTNKITGVGTPTLTADAATKGYVDTAISNLIDTAPGTLDTLNELAAALGDDPNFATTVTASIATKLPLAGGTMSGAIAMGTNKITGLGDPTSNQDASTKVYVDTADALKLNLSGGTMSGAIAMGTSKITGLGDPTANQDAATKTYVDTADALKLSLSGGTMSGAIAMGNSKITGLGTPTADADATTKLYVDGILGSATAAATSAAAAAVSASNAATSASNASTSASNAATSASNASTSATAAAASYDSFDDRYLGPKASAPTLDNDGNALLTGALYWNSTSNELYLWTGSVWTRSALSGTDYVLKSGDTMTGSLNVNGTVTATTFSGPLTGNVTGNVSGTASNVTGTVAIANGGTGATTSTGSGAVVLASSPALTTPNIGTPSAGTLTSCTGLPLSTGVTGTLPVANGGTGAVSQTAYAVLCGGTTSTGAFQSIAGVGTSGQILTSNGAGALPTFQAAGGGFTAGTAMMFVQTAAPTGWTKSTTHDNKALRVVSGSASSGGTTAFSTVFSNQTPTITTSGLSAGATTLTTAQIPSHNHTIPTVVACGPNAGFALATASPHTAQNTGATGGGGSHTHSISGSATSSAITLNVQYVDVIIATKN